MMNRLVFTRKLLKANRTNLSNLSEISFNNIKKAQLHWDIYEIRKLLADTFKKIDF